MITSTKLETSGDTLVYSSTGTTAITTVVICNTADPLLSDETFNTCTVSMNITSAAPNNVSNDANTIIKNLIIPAGETLFLSEERLVLDNGNQLRATASVANRLSITVSTLPV
jgi:hypothetical protein